MTTKRKLLFLLYLSFLSCQWLSCYLFSFLLIHWLSLLLRAFDVLRLNETEKTHASKARVLVKGKTEEGM